LIVRGYFGAYTLTLENAVESRVRVQLKNLKRTHSVHSGDETHTAKETQTNALGEDITGPIFEERQMPES